jgi:hypothetical protein
VPTLHIGLNSRSLPPKKLSFQFREPNIPAPPSSANRSSPCNGHRQCKMEKDLESDRPERISHFKRVFDQAPLTDDVINASYEGSGTEKDPYIVTWIDEDPVNPMNYPQWLKWMIVTLVAIATLAVAFVSSAYSGGIREILAEFGVAEIIGTLGISLFVLGFAVGPLMWAPMSGESILVFESISKSR